MLCPKKEVVIDDKIEMKIVSESLVHANYDEISHVLWPGEVELFE